MWFEDRGKEPMALAGGPDSFLHHPYYQVGGRGRRTLTGALAEGQGAGSAHNLPAHPWQMSEEVLGGAVDASGTSARPCFLALGGFISMAMASFSAGFSFRCTLAHNEAGPVLFSAGP